MYTFDDVNDSGHPVHALHPWVEEAIADFAATVATEERGGFPCTFSRAALRRRTLYFAFIDDVRDGAQRAQLRQSLSVYLDRTRTLPKVEEHLHVLLIFGRPAHPPLSLAEYHGQAWTLMADWTSNDPDPWPASIPTDPHEPFWSLCFRSTQLFVNVSCPAHVQRRSRNLGRSLVLVTQPREAFDIVAGPGKRGDALRRVIRERMDVYDSVPWPTYLGTYGRGELEWPQYAVADSVEGDAEQLARGCPLHGARPDGAGHARRRDAT